VPAFFLMIPFLVWAAFPGAYFPEVVAFGLFVYLAVGAYFVRKLMRENAADASISPPTAEYRWRKGWSNTEFQRHFSLFLRGRGWRILSSTPVDENRLAVVIDKQKFRLALLCVQPGHAATNDDDARLEATRSDHRVTDVVLVTQDRPTAEERNSAITRNVWLLSFEDLDNLDEAVAVEF